MTSREEWQALAEMCAKASGADRVIDGHIAYAIRLGDVESETAPWGWRAFVLCFTSMEDAIADMTRDRSNVWREELPRYTSTKRIDAIIGLIREKLPGWIWKACECCVSDDAWLCPDWNSPEHGERMRRELGEPRLDHWTNHGIDVERRPSGNPALALCEAFCRAMAEMSE